MPRRVLRTLAASLTMAGFLVTAATAAHAHITVTPTTAVAGSDATLTFRVPDESESADTTSVSIVLPEGAALHEVSVLPKPGWNVTLSQGVPEGLTGPQGSAEPAASAAPSATGSPAVSGTNTSRTNMPGMNMPGMNMPGMNMPAAGHGSGRRVDPAPSATPAPAAAASAAQGDQEAGPAIRSITWRARGLDNAIAPGEFQEFKITAAMPKARPSIALAAIQTYDDGTIVRWIEEAATGAPEPAHPAPMLTLTPTGGEAAMPGMPMPGAQSVGAPAKPASAGNAMAMPGMDMSGMSMPGMSMSSGLNPINVALAVGIFGLVAALVSATLAGMALTRSRHRTTVSPPHVEP